MTTIKRRHFILGIGLICLSDATRSGAVCVRLVIIAIYWLGPTVVADLRIIGSVLANKLYLLDRKFSFRSCFRLPQNFFVHRVATSYLCRTLGKVRVHQVYIRAPHISMTTDTVLPDIDLSSWIGDLVDLFQSLTCDGIGARESATRTPSSNPDTTCV